MRFYVFSLGDAAASLTVWSRTLGTGANDSLLSLTEISQSYNWQRAEATFSSSDNSKVREEQYLNDRGAILKQYLSKYSISPATDQVNFVIAWEDFHSNLYRACLQTMVLRVRKSGTMLGMFFPIRLSSDMKEVTDTGGLLLWMTSLSQGSAYSKPRPHPAQAQPQMHPLPQRAPPIHVRYITNVWRRKANQIMDMIIGCFTLALCCRRMSFSVGSQQEKCVSWQRNGAIIFLTVHKGKTRRAVVSWCDTSLCQQCIWSNNNCRMAT